MAKNRVKNVPSRNGRGSGEDTAKVLENALGQIEKAFGQGSIMRLNDDGRGVPGIPTGALSLDLALGGRGLPKGRIIEIYGPESSGKTTLALSAIGNVQKAGGVAAFIDAEHALDPSWAKRQGVDLEDLLVSQPTYGEEALQIAEMLIKSNAVDVVVVDSVAALVPKAELDGEIGDTHVGLQARMMSQAMRKVDRGDLPQQMHRHFHQPNPGEDRRDVRLPGDHPRRAGAEVLLLRPHRRPPDRHAEGRGRTTSGIRNRRRRW